MMSNNKIIFNKCGIYSNNLIEIGFLIIKSKNGWIGFWKFSLYHGKH